MKASTMTFARWVFLIAGLYGVVALAPLYFLENQIGVDTPPPINHPEFYYGFVGVALTWQFVYLVISMNPVRYRVLMVLGAVAKTSFGAAVWILFCQGRVGGMVAGFASGDLLWAVLFLAAFWRTSARYSSPLPKES